MQRPSDGSYHGCSGNFKGVSITREELEEMRPEGS